MNCLRKLLSSLFCHPKDKSNATEVVPETNNETQEEPAEELNISAKSFTDSNGQVFHADKSSSKGSLLFKDAHLLVYLGTVRIDLNNISDCTYESRSHGNGMISYIEHTLYTESGEIKKHDIDEWMGPSQDDYVSYMEDSDYRYLHFSFKDGKRLSLEDKEYDYEVWVWLKELFCKDTNNS